MDMYHWHVLVTYHWDVIGCFIWDLFETPWRRTAGTSSLLPLEMLSRYTNKTSWRRTTKTSWRRSIATSLGVSFEMYLRHHWDIKRDIVTTSPRLLVAGWLGGGRKLMRFHLKTYVILFNSFHVFMLDHIDVFWMFLCQS